MSSGWKRWGTTLLAVAGAGIGLGLLGTGGGYVASQDPDFCRSCHYMEPYYRQWQQSAHASASCVSCHPFWPVQAAVSGLRYFTGTYDTRPRAEVASASCLQEGCHQTRLLEGQALYQEHIPFDHTAHLSQERRGQHLVCTSCHAHMVQGEHIAVSPEVCFLCHFKGTGQAQALSGCTSCHASPGKAVHAGRVVFDHDTYLKKGAACQQCHIQVVEGVGGVPQDRCFSCHVERLEHYSDPEWLHARHTSEHGVDCLRCHERIRHGKVRMIQALEEDCRTCHEALHSPQKSMYLGRGGRGVADRPSGMFNAQVSCAGCHPTGHAVSDTQEDRRQAQRQACVECHGPGYDRMAEDWRRELGALVGELGGELERGEAELRRRPHAEPQQWLEQARHNYDLVHTGKGAHNVEYALTLLQAVTRDVDRSMERLRPGYRPPVRSPLLTTPDGGCGPLCHTSIGMPEQVPLKTMTLPHRRHLEKGVGCAKCHGADPHDGTPVSRAECSTCHHQLKETNCTACHAQQAALYTGKAEAWGAEGAPDPMAAEEVGCRECHDPAKPLSIEAVGRACVGCHEEGYERMLVTWRDQVAAELERLAALAAQARAKGAAGEGLARAEGWVELVTEGKGAHNQAFALELLGKAEKELQQVAAAGVAR
ncbi:MAG: NapC/NirT family cytochrome c [Candidatus Latescibacteria bacterium]|nr:NapC/NirT family cytochrome c [Candidatus Latescibacterota bacterium]